MYTLYHCPITCSTTVKIALELIGVEHEVKIIDLFEGEQFSEQFLAVNPLGKVPVLVEGDHVMTQGEAILLHLSQKYPEASLMPNLATEQGATALKWFNFVASTLHNDFSKVFKPERVASNHDEVKANAEELLIKHYEFIEQRLKESPFLAGESPTLADYYLAVTLAWSRVLSFELTERFEVLQGFKVALQKASPHSKSLQQL